MQGKQRRVDAVSPSPRQPSPRSLPNPDSYVSRGFHNNTKVAATGKFQTANTLTESVTIPFVHLFLFIYF